MPTSGFDSGFDDGFGWNGVGQLLLVVGDHARYEDGDVLVAKNRRAIRFCHAQHICWPRDGEGRKIGGMVGDTQPLLEKLFCETYQYKWERVSETEIKRTNLVTLSEVVYGSTPVEDPDRPRHMIHCHVAQHFAFRKRTKKMPLFGSPREEVEYGGRINASHAKLDNVWAEIEARTAEREAEHVDWPFTPRELSRFLAISVDDFDDAEAGELMAPLMDETDPDNPVRVKRRKHSIAWRGLRDVMEADVLDFTKQVDMRPVRKQVRAVTVQTKSL